MENKMKGMKLGKGMAALINPDAVSSETIAKFAGTPDSQKKEILEGSILVDIAKVIANKNQPRKIFKEKEIEELSQSIKENGVIQPLIVSQNDDGTFELIAGERRLRASKLAGIKQVPVVIKKLTKKDTLLVAIIENVQRADLNCVEEALAYYQLMDEFNLTQEEVAKKVGKERSTIANFLRILKLPRSVISSLQKDEISFGHAKVLASIKDDERIEKLANQAALESWSVRELENHIIAIEPTEKPKAREAGKQSERLAALENEIQAKSGMHIKLKLNNRNKGKVIINIQSKEEFNKLYELLVR